MIIHSFDDRSEALMGPGDFYGPQRQICDICILTFSHVILEELQQRFQPETAAMIGSANAASPAAAGIAISIFTFRTDEIFSFARSVSPFARDATILGNVADAIAVAIATGRFTI